MPLSPFGSRVNEIMSQPPKEISPGEAVSMYVRDQPAEVDFQAAAARSIAIWLRSYFRGEWQIAVDWNEAGRMYYVAGRVAIGKLGEVKHARAVIYTEQVEELSMDLDSWVACLEWVAISLQHDIDLASSGEVANAVSKLNKLAQAVEKKRIQAEEDAAIASIKRSAEAQ